VDLIFGSFSFQLKHTLSAIEASATPFEKSLCSVYISIYLNLQLNVAPLHNSILKSKQFKEVRRKLKCQMQQPHHFSPPFRALSLLLPAVHKVHAVAHTMDILHCANVLWYFRARKIDGIIKHSGWRWDWLIVFVYCEVDAVGVLAAAHPLPGADGANRGLALAGRKLKFHRRMQVNFCMKKMQAARLGVGLMLLVARSLPARSHSGHVAKVHRGKKTTSRRGSKLNYCRALGADPLRLLWSFH